MSLLQIAVLALVQGITEFLPISSWGHLILVGVVFGWPDQGLIMDVAMHVGTLAAVVAYFWKDVGVMLAGLARLAGGRRDPGARLAGFVVVGTLPVIAAGFVVNYTIAGLMRGVAVIGWTTLIFGVVLYLADRRGMTVRRVEHLTLADALIIGFAQVLSLVPGTSRSGITMTAARFLGFERPDSARFSMLLAMPTTLGAGALKGIDLYRLGDVQLTLDALLAAGVAFAAALATIALLMSWLKRATFTPFVIYRLVLGIGLLYLAYAPG